MNDKIKLLIKYIEDRFPNGCDDLVPRCDSRCILYDATEDSLEGDICRILCNMEFRGRYDK